MADYISIEINLYPLDHITQLVQCMLPKTILFCSSSKVIYETTTVEAHILLLHMIYTVYRNRKLLN